MSDRRALRTFIPGDVEQVGRRLTFTLEGRPIVGELAAGATCRRCKKALTVGAVTPVATTRENPAVRASRAWPPRPAFRYVIAYYHARCVPPGVVHDAPGSRPGPGRSRVAPVDASASPPQAARIGVGGPAIVEFGAAVSKGVIVDVTTHGDRLRQLLDTRTGEVTEVPR